MKNNTFLSDNRESSKKNSIKTLAQNRFVEDLSDREAESLNGGKFVVACGYRLPHYLAPFFCYDFYSR